MNTWLGASIDSYRLVHDVLAGLHAAGTTGEEKKKYEMGTIVQGRIWTLTNEGTKHLPIIYFSRCARYIDEIYLHFVMVVMMDAASRILKKK